MKHCMRRRQLGMTFIGLMCILVLVGIIGYAGVRLTPVYLNYMNVVKTMQTTAADFRGDNPDPVAIRNALERHWEITTITAVDYKDIEIEKTENGVTLHVAYDDSEPYIANISLAVHFDKTVKVE